MSRLVRIVRSVRITTADNVIHTCKAGQAIDAETELGKAAIDSGAGILVATLEPAEVKAPAKRKRAKRKKKT